MSSYEFWDELGKIFNAVVAYQEKSIEFNKRFINPWIRLGNVFDKQDRHKEAIEAYRKAIEIDPDNAQVWCDLGSAYFQMEAYDQAVDAFKKAIELDPQLGWPYSNLALTYVTQDNHEQAVFLFQKSIELLHDDKDKAVCWNRLGNLYRKLNEYDLALAAFRKADQLDHENTGFRDSLDEVTESPSLEANAAGSGDQIEEAIANPIRLIVEDSHADEVASAAALEGLPAEALDEAPPALSGTEQPDEAQAVEADSLEEAPSLQPAVEPESIEQEAAIADSAQVLSGQAPQEDLVHEEGSTEPVIGGDEAETPVAASSETFDAPAQDEDLSTEASEETSFSEQVSGPVEEAASPEMVSSGEAREVRDQVNESPAEVTPEPATVTDQAEEVLSPAVAVADEEPSAGSEVEPAVESSPAEAVAAAPVEEPAAVSETVEADVEALGETDTPAGTVEDTLQTQQATFQAPSEPEEVSVAEPAPALSVEQAVAVASEETMTIAAAEEPAAAAPEQAEQEPGAATLEATTPEEGEAQAVPEQAGVDLTGTAAQASPDVEEADAAAAPSQQIAYEEFLKDDSEALSALTTIPVTEIPEPQQSSIPAEPLTKIDSSGELRIEMDTKNAHVWNELGNVYFNNSAVDDSIIAYSKAIELDRWFAWPYSNLALAYVQKGRFAEAILLYQRSIELFTAEKDKAISWNRLGNVYRRMCDYENAIAAYQRADELDPDNTTLSLQSRFSLLGSHQLEQSPAYTA